MYINFENKNMKKMFPLVHYTYPSNLSKIIQMAEHLTVMKSECLFIFFLPLRVVLGWQMVLRNQSSIHSCHLFCLE